MSLYQDAALDARRAPMDLQLGVVKCFMTVAAI